MKKQCPICASKNYAKILWGLPADMREIEPAIERKEIVLGGCCMSGNDPRWRRCNKCFYRWK